LARLVPNGSEALACPACHIRYPVLDGIPMLGLAQDFYYHEIPLDAMESFLEHARRGELAQLFRTEDRERPWSFLLGSHFERTRASWMFTTALPPDPAGRRALDFGAGWGINAIALAPYVTEVVALELSRHRLLNLRLQADRQELRNVTAICGGDTPRLPFPDAHFDLAILNGVIEWIPVGRPGSPRAQQLAFLREIARITKPAGELFLASENRYAYQYWIGRPDDHTGLLFGSLLPRPLATVYSRLRSGRPYQHYTYSRAQYRRLLARAGFRHCQFHGLIPAHRLFHKIFPLSRGRIVDREETRGSALRDALLGTRAAAPLASALGIRATRAAPGPSFLERLARRLDEARLLDAPLEPEPYKLVTTNFSAKAAFRTADACSGLLAKIPLTEPKRALQARALAEQARWRGRAPVALFVSPLLECLDFEGNEISVESLCRARRRRGPLGERVYREVEEVLLAFANPRGSGSAAEMWPCVMEPFTAHLPPEHRAAVERLSVATPLRDLPACYQHGDFHWGNLFTHGRAGLARIVDWEWATPAGLPLADFLHLIANHDVVGLSPRYVSVLTAALNRTLPDRSLDGIAERLLENWGLRWEDVKPLAAAYLYDTLRKHWESSASYGLGERFLTATGHAVMDAMMVSSEW
jgi:SAM-dependent methyltransferase